MGFDVSGVRPFDFVAYLFLGFDDFGYWFGLVLISLLFSRVC